MSETNTYWAAETSQQELVGRAMRKYGAHLTRLRVNGVLWRAYALMSAHDGWGVDGFRTASALRVAGEQGEVTELHVNAVKPVIQNVLSLICAQRPAVKPVAVNGDAATTAQTTLASQLHEVYDRKTSAAELEVETVRGGLLASAWWLVQEWAAHEGAEYAYDESSDSMLYEGDVATFTLPPWAVAADMVASNVDQRRWVMFCRQMNRFELAERVKDPAVKEKLLQYTTKQASTMLDAEARTSWSDVEMLERLRGDYLDEEDGVIVWELRHLPTPALPSGRLVKWVNADCVLWDSMAAVSPKTGQPVRYPYDEKELHAYDFVPERKPGTTQGHTSMFDLTGLQQFVDLCTTSMATTINLMGMPHIWSRTDPKGAKKLAGGPKVLQMDEKPEVLDLPALKPEVVEASDWAQGMMAKAGSLNDVVMGNPSKGMPASAQALQRAQAVQYHEVSQRNFVRLVSRNANGRLRLLKRFARTERVAELAGAAGEYQRKEWSAKDIAGVERFDVEPINPMSATFEGRQSILEMFPPNVVDVKSRLDFLQTGSIPKALESGRAQDEIIDRNMALLQRGIGLPKVASIGPKGEPVFSADGDFVRVLKSDPHHLAIPRYLSVCNTAASRTDARAVAALSAAMESQRLWTSCTPDECVAFGLPFLPSHQMAMSAPPMGAPMPPGAPESMPVAGDEGAVNLPSPPPSPLSGETESPDSLELANA